MGILGTILVVVGLVFGSQFCAAQHHKRLLRTGAPATAEIVRVVDTGNRYNRNPEIELTLVVTSEAGGEPYEARITEVLDAAELQAYVIGARLDVRYDPDDPRDIAIAGLATEEPEQATPSDPSATPPASAQPSSPS